MKGSDLVFDCVYLLYYKCILQELWWIMSSFSRLDKKQKSNNKISQKKIMKTFNAL